MLSKDISPSTDTYAALMSAYSFHGSAEPVRELLKGMAAHQVTLTRGMVSALLEAYINRWGSRRHLYPHCTPLTAELYVYYILNAHGPFDSGVVRILCIKRPWAIFLRAALLEGGLIMHSYIPDSIVHIVVL